MRLRIVIEAIDCSKVVLDHCSSSIICHYYLWLIIIRKHIDHSWPSLRTIMNLWQPRSTIAISKTIATADQLPLLTFPGWTQRSSGVAQLLNSFHQLSKTAKRVVNPVVIFGAPHPISIQKGRTPWKPRVVRFALNCWLPKFSELIKWLTDRPDRLTDRLTDWLHPSFLTMNQHSRISAFSATIINHRQPRSSTSFVISLWSNIVHRSGH